MNLKLLVAIQIFLQFAKSCPNEQKCRACDFSKSLTRICTLCESTYFNDDIQSCDIVPEIKDCSEYNFISKNNIVCKSCRLGYFLANPKECKKCSVDKCALCREENSCHGCFEGMFAFENKCDIKKQCLLENCDVCEILSGDIPRCNLCSPGFAFDSKNKCVKGPKNCEVIDPLFSNLCKVCREGFYITDQSHCLENDPTNQKGSFPYFTILVLLIVISGAVFYGHRQYRIKSAKTNNPSTEFFVS